MHLFSEVGDDFNIMLFASSPNKVFPAGEVNTRSAIANSIIDGRGCGSSGSKWLLLLLRRLESAK